MKTLFIAGLMLLGVSGTAQAESILCNHPWEGYVWGACLELYPELKPARIIYRTRYVYVPVYRHRHHRHWWN